MRVKLVELYHTRYFYISYVKDLTYIWDAYLNLRNNKQLKYHAGSDLAKQILDCAYANADVEFDLAGAKLTTDVTDLVNNYTRKGILFVDTADPVRNSILHLNKERMIEAEKPTTLLPKIEFNQSLKDYLNSLSRDVIYTLQQVTDNRQTLPIEYPLAVIILIRRPTIKLDASHHLSNLMRFISEMLPVDYVLSCDDFFFTTTEGTRTVQVVDGKIATQQRGLVSVEDAMTIGYLVPSILGTTNLSHQHVWSDILTQCINLVNSSKRKKDLFLSEVL